MIWADPGFKHTEAIRLPHSADRYVCGLGEGTQSCGQFSSVPCLWLFAGLSRSLVLTPATCIVPGSRGGERSYLSQPSLSRSRTPCYAAGGFTTCSKPEAHPQAGRAARSICPVCAQPSPPLIAGKAVGLCPLDCTKSDSSCRSEIPLQYGKLSNKIQHNNNKKIPGPDTFTHEFHQTLQEKSVPRLHKLY